MLAKQDDKDLILYLLTEAIYYDWYLAAAVAFVVIAVITVLVQLTRAITKRAIARSRRSVAAASKHDAATQTAVAATDASVSTDNAVVTQAATQTGSILSVSVSAAVQTTTDTAAAAVQTSTDTAEAACQTTCVVVTVPGRRRVVKVDALDVLNVMKSAKWLPFEASCLCTGGMNFVQQAQSAVQLTIQSSMAVDTLMSILQYHTVTALQLQCGDLTDDVTTALSNAAVQQSLLKNLTTCSIENCEKLSFTVVQALMASMPSSLHSLDISQAKTSRSYLAATAQLVVPASVKHIGIMFIGWKLVMPEGLLTLRVNDCYRNAWRAVPATLKELHLTNYIETLPTLPNGLLVFNMTCTPGTLPLNFQLNGVIPATVTHLKLAETQERLVTSWPPQLVALDVGQRYQHRLGKLPQTLTHLTMRMNREAHYLHHLRRLPNSLKVLDAANIWYPIEHLPEALEVLRLDLHEKPLPVLPETLKELRLAGYGCKQITSVLPAALKVLDLGWSYSFEQCLDDGMLPASLHTLCEQYKLPLIKLPLAVQVHRVAPRYDINAREIW
jgi:hypothetical protein